MFANLVHVHLDLPYEEARAHLEQQVLPRIKQTPGLVAAYWFGPERDRGFSIAIFESEQDAQAAAQMVQPGSHPAPGITVDQLETREVIASL